VAGTPLHVTTSALYFAPIPLQHIELFVGGRFHMIFRIVFPVIPLGEGGNP
jgi:hypothetical protein